MRVCLLPCVCPRVCPCQRGVLIGACGERSVRLRPMLVFKPKHAAVFLENLEVVLASL